MTDSGKTSENGVVLELRNLSLPLISPPLSPFSPSSPSPCLSFPLSMIVDFSMYHGSRFRSRLSSVFGVGEKKRLVVYSGRGRPPKRAFMAGEGSQVGGVSVTGWEEPQQWVWS